MNADEIVIAEPQAERGPVVLPLAAETVRQAGESPDVGPHS